MSFLKGKSSEAALFDTLLNKATSHLNLETEWGAILNICDLIRQQDVSPKYAATAVKRKFSSDNPHSVIYTLQTLESMVKNCGTPLHDEIFNRDFLDNLKDIVHKPEPVKGKVLEVVQIWAQAFGSRYKSIDEIYKALKNEGFSFPALKASDAMFESEIAPEWKEGSSCHRCRANFSTFRRRHHCRSCGNIFCDECSSKRSIIPRYGIEKEVRVCDPCYEEINKATDTQTSGSADSTQQDSSRATNKDKERELELKEKEELELALAISASEAEVKEKNRQRQTPSNGYSGSSATNHTGGGGRPNDSSTGLYSSFDTSDLDPELARYLNRNYWEKKSSEQERQAYSQPIKTAASVNPTAPVAFSQEAIQTTANGPAVEPSVEEKDVQRDEFLGALSSSIEIFVNRMRSNSVRGRSIAADSTVQTLFMTLNAMHPQLIQHMNDAEARRNDFEELQDKLMQLHDAREALNALREEHEARRRAEQQERERQRYTQMMQKLEVMRHKKHEYMEYQRQLALQRMQEQEREYQVRMEAQKQRLAIEQYRKQFPYSSGAYQQHFQQPPPPGSEGLPQQQPQSQGHPQQQQQQHGPYQPSPQHLGYQPAASSYPGAPQQPPEPYQMMPASYNSGMAPPPPYTYHPDPYMMHNMMHSLPGQSPQMQPPQNHQMPSGPHSLPPSQPSQNPPPQQGPVQPGFPQQGYQMPPQQQQQPPQPVEEEPQLIQF